MTLLYLDLWYPRGKYDEDFKVTEHVVIINLIYRCYQD